MTNYQGLVSTTAKPTHVSHWCLSRLSVSWRGVPVSLGVYLDGSLRSHYDNFHARNAYFRGNNAFSHEVVVWPKLSASENLGPGLIWSISPSVFENGGTSPSDVLPGYLNQVHGAHKNLAKSPSITCWRRILRQSLALICRHQIFEYIAYNARGNFGTKGRGRSDVHVIFVLYRRVEKADVDVGNCDCSGWQLIFVGRMNRLSSIKRDGPDNSNWSSILIGFKLSRLSSSLDPNAH